MTSSVRTVYKLQVKKTERKREAEVGRDRGGGEGEREEKEGEATEVRRDGDRVGVRGPCDHLG